MRKLVLTTAAIAAVICLAVAGEPEYGTLTDTRDGQTYRTVVIGGKKWMAQNLNYKTDNSWCYNDSLSYCNKYGRLYNWSGAKNACPEGWHVASGQDWWDLTTTSGEWNVACKKLKAKSGWIDYKGKSGNGINALGFSALPGGLRRTEAPPDSEYVGEHVIWWIAAEPKWGFGYVGKSAIWWINCTDSSDCGVISMTNNNSLSSVRASIAWDYSLSVRCVADSK